MDINRVDVRTGLAPLLSACLCVMLMLRQRRGDYCLVCPFNALTHIQTPLALCPVHRRFWCFHGAVVHVSCEKRSFVLQCQLVVISCYLQRMLLWLLAVTAVFCMRKGNNTHGRINLEVNSPPKTLSHPQHPPRIHIVRGVSLFK